MWPLVSYRHQVLATSQVSQVMFVLGRLSGAGTSYTRLERCRCNAAAAAADMSLVRPVFDSAALGPKRRVGDLFSMTILKPH